MCVNICDVSHVCGMYTCSRRPSLSPYVCVYMYQMLLCCCCGVCFYPYTTSPMRAMECLGIAIDGTRPGTIATCTAGRECTVARRAVHIGNFAPRPPSRIMMSVRSLSKRSTRRTAAVMVTSAKIRRCPRGRPCPGQSGPRGRQRSCPSHARPRDEASLS
jgi:hypothetical protein